MSKEERRALQSERLVKMVKYVYENQKPYRAKMDAVFGEGAAMLLRIRPDGAIRVDL